MDSEARFLGKTYTSSTDIMLGYHVTKSRGSSGIPWIQYWGEREAEKIHTGLGLLFAYEYTLTTNRTKLAINPYFQHASTVRRYSAHSTEYFI